MKFTPDAALAAKSNDELVALFAAPAPWPLWHIIETLALRGSDMIDAALRGLQHPHPQVRRWCAELMDQHGDERCVEPLLALLDDPVAHVRWQAIHSLGCQRCKAAPLNVQQHVTQRMTELILSDPSTRVRSEALVALTLQTEAATPEVMAAVRAYQADLSSRERTSKRERAFLRGLKAVTCAS